MSATCDTFWGSHGCELPEGHDPEQAHPIHECSVPVLNDDGEIIDRDVCSQAQYIDAERIHSRFLTQVPEVWTEWRVLKLPLFRLDEEKVR